MELQGFTQWDDISDTVYLSVGAEAVEDIDMQLLYDEPTQDALDLFDLGQKIGSGAYLGLEQQVP